LQTRSDWVCTWGIINKCNIPLPPAPAWALLNSQHLIVLASMITMDQKNITTQKWSIRQLFTAATQHLTPDVVKYKNQVTLLVLKLLSDYVGGSISFNIYRYIHTLNQKCIEFIQKFMLGLKKCHFSVIWVHKIVLILLSLICLSIHFNLKLLCWFTCKTYWINNCVFLS
jgi:hypothetical protein